MATAAPASTSTVAEELVELCDPAPCGARSLAALGMTGRSCGPSIGQARLDLLGDGPEPCNPRGRCGVSSARPAHDTHRSLT
jgi:hypothetical protein